MIQGKTVAFTGFKQQMNVKINVRPYADKKGVTPAHRCLIFENLPMNMTSAALKTELESMGWLVKNAGEIKNGVALKCEMLTMDATDCLVILEEFTLGGQTVTIRPFFTNSNARDRLKSPINKRSYASPRSNEWKPRRFSTRNGSQQKKNVIPTGRFVSSRFQRW